MIASCDGAGVTPVLSVDDCVAFLSRDNVGGANARDAAASAILSSYAGSVIRVSRRPSGRPRLAPPWPELGVSLSHRGIWLLTGFSPRHDVGVDIELADASIDPASMARDHFSPDEAAAIAGSARQHDLFFRLWVAKEACLKATGRGIHDGLHAPDLSAHLAGLLQDGVIIQANLAAYSARIVVRRVIGLEARDIYCALCQLRG